MISMVILVVMCRDFTTPHPLSRPFYCSRVMPSNSRRSMFESHGLSRASWSLPFFCRNLMRETEYKTQERKVILTIIWWAVSTAHQMKTISRGETSPMASPPSVRHGREAAVAPSLAPRRLRSRPGAGSSRPQRGQQRP